ncbi:7994_t:CDS:2 [Entrophospora sp. SA101]|nr:7994_t:CDS:2 [Entrophospora sp. SA101]
MKLLNFDSPTPDSATTGTGKPEDEPTPSDKPNEEPTPNDDDPSPANAA